MRRERASFIFRPVAGLAAAVCLAGIPAVLPGAPDASDEPVIYELDFRVAGSDLYENIHFPVFRGNGFAMENAELSDELAFVTRGRSRLYHYEGPSPLVFYRASGDGSESRAPVARLDLSKIENPKAPQFLLFLPRDGNGPEFGIFPVALSRDRLSSGDLVVLNASPGPVAFSTTDGETKGILKRGTVETLAGEDLPGAHIQVRENGGGDEGDEGDEGPDSDAQITDTGKVQTIGLRFAVKDSGEGDWNPLHMDILSAYEDEVRFLVFYPPAVEGSHNLRRFLFTLSLPEKPKKKD